MNKNKDQRRKDKLAARGKRVREHDAARKLRSLFPEFVFDESEADPEFASIIKEAVRQFRFSELPAFDQIAFKDMKESGAAYALSIIRLAMNESQNDGVATPYATHGDFLWQLTLGEIIFSKVPESDRENFLPMNNVRFIYQGKNILVKFYSMFTRKHKGGTLYFSRRNTEIDFDGKKYIVAFSKEAIKRIGERTIHAPFSYRGVGEFFAFIDLCMHYEPCTLPAGNPAFTFFDYCIERTWSFSYVKNILVSNNLDPTLGQYYYRVGYCPTELVDERFALATTLLFPGFGKTPEFKSLRNSRISDSEKQRLETLAKQGEMKQLQETRDFSALRWFHEHGVPQVIQTQKKMFHTYGDPVITPTL